MHFFLLLAASDEVSDFDEAVDEPGVKADLRAGLSPVVASRAGAGGDACVAAVAVTVKVGTGIEKLTAACADSLEFEGWSEMGCRMVEQGAGEQIRRPLGAEFGLTSGGAE